MELFADLHVHTSGAPELGAALDLLCAGAKQRGLGALALSDHLPCRKNVFSSWEAATPLPPMPDGTVLLPAAEADIVSLSGHVAALPAGARGADSLLMLAAAHTYMLEPSSAQAHTAMFIAALNDPRVDILAHPCDDAFPCEMEAVAACAARLGKALELNAMSVERGFATRHACIGLLHAARRHGALISIASDAQRPDMVGRTAPACLLADEVGFPPELIVNASSASLAAFLSARGKRLY